LNFFGFMYRAVLVKQGEGEGDLWSTFILGLWAFSFSFLYIARQFKFAHRKYIIVFCQFVVLITSTFFSSSLPNVSSSIQTYKSKQTKVAPQRLQVYVCGKDNLMLSSSRNLTMPWKCSFTAFLSPFLDSSNQVFPDQLGGLTMTPFLNQEAPTPSKRPLTSLAHIQLSPIPNKRYWISKLSTLHF